MRNFFVAMLMIATVIVPRAYCMAQSNSDVPPEWLNKWQFTGEIGASMDAVRVRGDSSAAGSEPGRTYFRTINARGEYSYKSGAKIGLNFQSYEPMSQRKKNEEKLRFTATLTGRGTDWTLGDMSPRLSQWSLQGNRLFGLHMKRDTARMGMDLIMGKYRKSPGSGPEDHFVTGAGFRWANRKKFTVSSEMVYTFHEDLTDGEAFNERNNVFTTAVTYKFEAGRQIDVQYANSATIHRTVPGEPELHGDAFRIQGVFAFKKMNIETTFEDVDDGFTTMSGSASSGRRVLITQISAPLGGALFTTGYTHNKTDSSDVTSTPVMLTLQPFGGKNTTVTLDYSKQKSDYEDEDATFDRSRGIRVRHRAGATVYTIGARGESFSSGSSVSRILSFDASSALSDSFTMKLKANREKRSGEDDTRNAYRASLTWDISDWTALDLSEETRERPGRTKRTYRAKFKHSDMDNNFEVGLDYRFSTERGVKEQALLADTVYYF